MESRAKLLGHPAHQMLIVFPLGLLATAVIFDVVFLASGMLEMATVAYWLIAAGLIGALVAAPFGTIDWTAIPPGTRAKRIGAMHGSATSSCRCCSWAAGCCAPTRRPSRARWPWCCRSQARGSRW